MDGHSHFQVAGMIGSTVNPLAKNTEPAAERRILAGETRTRPDVREIENEIVDRISFLFERRRDRETFACLEKRENNAAARGCSVWRHQTKLSPSVGGRVGDCRGEIVLQFRAGAADERDRFALGRIEERGAA